LERQELQSRLRALPARGRVITALDVPDAASALDLAGRLGGDGRLLKVGMELFTAAGPDVVRRLVDAGQDVFLDLKFKDIPNTVAGAVRGACALGVSMLTLHADGGARMLAAAAEAAREAPPGPGGRRPALLGVTVLTSLTREELDEVHPGADPLADRIARLAGVIERSGCDGLVCSAADLPALKRTVGDRLLTITPGIRPAGAAVGDQRRVTTPADAVNAGADFLVIGRPITGAPDPAAALAAITEEIEQA